MHQGAAQGWLDTVDERGGVGFCRATQVSFLRLLTTDAVLAPYGNAALSNVQAWATYERLLADDRITVRLDEPVGLDAHLRAFGARGTPSPKLWMDAYLASFALAAGCVLVTTDPAFRQFPGLALSVLDEVH